MRLLVTLKRALLIALASMLPATGAKAALIDSGVTTLDTESGLSWLDLTETAGLLPSDIFSGALGLLADGWMVASGSQVDSLFESAGVPSPGSATQFYATPDIPQLLLGTLGQTGSSITGQIFGQGWADNGAGILSAPGYGYQPPDLNFTLGSANIIPGPNNLPTIGVYLYRRDSDQIPVPPTYLLILVSLVILMRNTRFRARGR